MITIPAINARFFEEAQRQLKVISGFAEWVHIDVVDGAFSPHLTWSNPEELPKLKIENSKLKIELHLMVANPESVIDTWLRTGLVKRAIVHLEAMTDSVYILEKCKKYGVEAMLAINPGTDVERLLANKDDFRYFQILAVNPGWAGQKFDPKIIDKVRFLRKNMPDAIIEVDGGINAETAKLVKEAGANIIVSASYILDNQNPKAKYEELSRL